MWVGELGQTAIAFDIKIETLENVDNIADTIAAAKDGFNLGIQAFDQTAVQASHKVIGQMVEPVG